MGGGRRWRGGGGGSRALRAPGCDAARSIKVGDQGWGTAALGSLGLTPSCGILVGLPSPLGASHQGIPCSPAPWDTPPARVKVGTDSPQSRLSLGPGLRGS